MSSTAVAEERSLPFGLSLAPSGEKKRLASGAMSVFQAPPCAEVALPRDKLFPPSGVYAKPGTEVAPPGDEPFPPSGVHANPGTEIAPPGDEPLPASYAPNENGGISMN